MKAFDIWTATIAGPGIWATEIWGSNVGHALERLADKWRAEGFSMPEGHEVVYISRKGDPNKEALDDPFFKELMNMTETSIDHADGATDVTLVINNAVEKGNTKLVGLPFIPRSGETLEFAMEGGFLRATVREVLWHFESPHGDLADRPSDARFIRVRVFADRIDEPHQGEE